MSNTSHGPPSEPTRAQRWRASLIVVAVTGVFAAIRFLHYPQLPSDLDQLWYAARALIQGGDPYAAIGPGRAFQWRWPLFYPLPAVMLIAPFALLPLAVARLAFSLVSVAALGYAVGPRWRVLWPLLLSTSYYLAVSRNQWSPLVLSAFWLPLLGFVVAAKPNVGILAVVAQTRRTALKIVAGACVLTVASIVLQPSWPGEWVRIVRSLPNQTIPLLQPGGFLLAAALLRWRVPEGRVVLAAALSPQTPSLYDILPLFAVCRTLRQTLVFAALTHVLQLALLGLGPYRSYEAGYAMLARLLVYFALFPAMLLVFVNHRRRGISRNQALPTPHDAASLRDPLNAALAALVALGLALQLWLVFGQ